MIADVLPITKAELCSLMIDEAVKEGWHYSQEDVDFYFNYSRNQITALKINGELAGCLLMHIAAASFQEKSLCSFGLFLVTSKYRGQKKSGLYLAKQVRKRSIERYSNPIVYFHAVPTAVNFYKRVGFTQTALIDIFYALDVQNLNQTTLKPIERLFNQGSLKQLNQNQITEIDAYNKTIFCGENGAGVCDFVHHWLKRSDAITLAYYEQGVVKGYGMLTICHRPHNGESGSLIFRLSPLYADSLGVAESLLKGLVYTALLKGAKRIELSTLADLDSPYGQILKDIGFKACGQNYILCNQASMTKKRPPILEHIFASLPLEYPHEVSADLR